MDECKCISSDLALFKRSFVIESCSTSLPGGDQVDGSPPAASIMLKPRKI